MKRDWIRRGIILFALVLGLCFASGALAESLPEAATELTPGVEATATITGGEATYFRFIPDKTAIYVFYSSCSDYEDPYVYLYTAAEGGMNCNDSAYYGGSYNNFRMKYRLYEGTAYYFMVNVRDGEGSFPVILEEYNGLIAEASGETYINKDPGETFELTVAATSGVGKVTYQWMYEDENYLWTEIEGQTSATYSGVAEAGHKRYVCYLTDGETTESVRFYVTGTDTLTISSNSYQNFDVVPNETLTLEVQAVSDSGEVTYQWYKNWNDDKGEYHSVELKGANSATYQTEEITHNTTYYCSVKSSTEYGQVYFYVNVNAPITVTNPEVTSWTVERGGSAEMAITATSDWGSLQYQWYCYNPSAVGGIAEIEGATKASYTAENLQERTTYYCMIRNGFTETQSNSFEISIAGDYYAYAYADTSNYPYSFDLGDPFTLRAVAYDNDGNGLDDVSYQWYGPFSSKSDQIQSKVIEGETGNTLTVQSANRAGYYLCKVTNNLGVERDAWVQVFINSDLDIASENAIIEAVASDGATLSVTATSSAGEVSYQWYIEDEERGGFEYAHMIDGATGSTYTVTNPRKSYIIYYCVVTDVYGNTITTVRQVNFYGNVSLNFNGDGTATIAPGESVTVAVNATGDGDITYRWYTSEYKNGEWGERELFGNTTEPFCTFSNIQSNMQIECYAHSPFGQNSDTFWVYVDNQLRLSRIGDYGRRTVPGGTLTLETEVERLSGDVSYQWYRQVSDNYGHFANMKISGATEASYTTEPVTHQERYCCYVYDSYGNQNSCDFQIDIENNLQATVYGKEVNSETLYVSVGQNAVMKVSATATKMEGITYCWTRRTGYDESNRWWKNSQVIGNGVEDELSDTVTEYTQYECRVQDAYGNDAYVYFYIMIDNQLEATAFETGEERCNMTVVPNQDAEMRVSVSATDTSGITYSWSRFVNGYGWQEIDNATGDSLKAGITGFTEFRCEVHDGYHNVDYVYFVIEIDNNLEAFAADTGMTSKNILVELGADVEMQVEATATNMDGITYHWSELSNEGYWQEIGNETGDTLTVKANGSAQYRCSVQDAYNNSRNVWFYIRIENGLQIRAVGETTFRVTAGQTATLQAIATCNNGGVTYRWTKEYYDDEGGWHNEPIENATGETYTTDAITSQVHYYCYAKDMYGTEKSVYFTVGIDNKLTAAAVGETIKTVDYNGTAEMKVSASCLVGDPSYQWYQMEQRDFNSWTWDVIPGATSSIYSVQNVTMASRYVCRVSDPFGNSTDVYFTIEINNHLTANSYDSSRKVTVGSTVTLTASATCDEGELTYQWGEEVLNEWGYTTTRAIPGATGTSFETEPICAHKQYACQITDQFGNTITLYYSIGIDNHLVVEADGGNEITVLPGQDAMMRVIASCDDDSHLVYQWYRRTEYSESSWSSSEINGATSNTFTVNNVEQSSQYYCRVSDGYENPKEIYFTIRIDNGMQTAYPKNGVQVAYGEDAVVEVEAVCINGALTYQWYYDGTLDPTVDGPVYTVQNVTNRHRLVCYVTDIYGNQDICGISVNVASGLWLEIKSVKVNGVEVSDLYTGNVSVPYGADVEILVESGCNYGDVTSQWYSAGNLVTGTESYTLTNLTKAVSLTYMVSDEFNNHAGTSWSFQIENGFTVTAVGELFRQVNAGDQVELGVTVTKTGGEVTYRWTKDGQRLSETGDSITFIADKSARYYCSVTDQYGNAITKEFYVNVGTGHVLTLGQTVTVTSETGGEQVYFFTPEESGTYELTSTGVFDPWVYLYDSDGKIIGSDEDSGEEKNFKLSAELTAGILYKYSIRGLGMYASISIKLTKVQYDGNYIPAGTYVMQVGQAARLPYVDCTITSNTPDTVQVSGTTLTTLKAGTAKVTIDRNNGYSGIVTIYVSDGSMMTMPSAITMIETEAFANDSSVRFVTLGANMNSVGYFAFANSGLLQIVVPSMTTKLSVSSFQGIYPTILCQEGSAAEEFAQQNGYMYMYID